MFRQNPLANVAIAIAGTAVLTSCGGTQMQDSVSQPSFIESGEQMTVAVEGQGDKCGYVNTVREDFMATVDEEEFALSYGCLEISSVIVQDINQDGKEDGVVIFRSEGSDIALAGIALESQEDGTYQPNKENLEVGDWMYLEEGMTIETATQALVEQLQTSK